MIVATPRPPFASTLLCAALAALGAFVPALPAQRPGDRLLVCNRAEDTLSVFDPVTGRELATLRTGSAPSEIAVSPDNRIAVITNARSGVAGGRSADLTIVDVAAARVRREVQLRDPEGPRLGLHGVAFTRNGAVVVTAQTDGRLFLLDADRWTAEAAWRTGQRAPQLVAVTADGGWVATSSPLDGTVAYRDLTARRTDDLPKMTTAGAGAEGIAFHPSTKDAWVTSRETDLLSIVSAETGEVVRTFDTGRAPIRVSFTPRGDRALVTCVLGGELMIFDASAPAALAEVSIHGDRSEESSLPLAVISDPDSARAYVTCARGEFIAVVDLATAALVDRIDARRGPDGLAYARPTR